MGARIRLKRTVARATRRALIRWARGGRTASEPRVYLLLMNAGGMGGTIRATLNLAGHLAKNHEVEILSLVRRRERAFFPFPPGVTVTTIDDQRPGRSHTGLPGITRRLLSARSSLLLHPADRVSGRSSLWTDVQLARVLRSRNTGVLIATRPALNLAAAEVAPDTLVKIAQDHMNLRTYNQRLRRAIVRGYGGLDAVVTLTERDLATYRSKLEVEDRPELLAIPNAARGFGDLRSDVSARTVITAGRLTRQKAYASLIAAFARVVKAHPDWQLVICGSGPKRAHLERVIESRGMRDHVTLAGPVEDIGAAMASASIFALSSHFEGFPMVLLEAMSVGLPVVSFDCPTGPREIVENGRNGLLVRAGHIPGLARALTQMIEDEELRRRCSAGAVETAARYSLDTIGARWEQLIEQLTAARHERPAA